MGIESDILHTESSDSEEIEKLFFTANQRNVYVKDCLLILVRVLKNKICAAQTVQTLNLTKMNT